MEMRAVEPLKEHKFLTNRKRMTNLYKDPPPLQDSRLDLEPAEIKTLNLKNLPSFLGPAIEKIKNLHSRAGDEIEKVSVIVDRFIIWEHVASSALITTTMFLTWLATWLGLGFGFLILILWYLSFLYAINTQRLRKKIKTMTRKEHLLQFVNSDEESMEWFNQLLYRYWQALEPSLSAQLKESISTILDGLKVSGLDEIRLTKFTLGSQPPRIESVKTFPSTDDEVIVYDFDIVFAPFDEDEVSKKEMQMKELRNLEIVLQIKIAMVPLPVSLKEIMIEGKLRVQMTFMATFPHIKVIDLGFVSSPTIDFILKPLGADLKKIAGVGSLIKDIINTQLAGIIVNPSKFSLPLGEMMGKSETNTEMPVGVMRVAIYEAKGLKNIDVTGINIGLLCRYIRSCSFNVSWWCRDTKNKNHR